MGYTQRSPDLAALCGLGNSHRYLGNYYIPGIPDLENKETGSLGIIIGNFLKGLKNNADSVYPQCNKNENPIYLFVYCIRLDVGRRISN